MRYKQWTLTVLCLLTMGGRALADPTGDISIGRLTYSLNLQNWDTQLPFLNQATLRRAENKFTYRLSSDWTAVTLLDPGKKMKAGFDDSALQDLYLEGRLASGLRLRVGQFKIPFSEEGMHSSAHLDTVERSQFNVGSNKFSDLRELGAMVSFDSKPWLVQVGGFSGDPTNQSIGLSLHEVAMRVVYSPDKHWDIGTAFTRGDRHNIDKPLNTEELNDKNGLELRWTNQDWMFQAELVSGTQRPAGASTPVQRDGWYAKIRHDVSADMQLVLREDALFSHGPGAPVAEQDLTFGVNYWLARQPVERLLQVDWVHRNALVGPPLPSLVRTNFEIFFRRLS